MSKPDLVVLAPLVEELLATPREEQLRLLIKYLGTSSRAKVALASHILAGDGPPIVSMLTYQAFAQGRRPNHAVRLSEIVGRIGGPVGFEDWMLLLAATALPRKRLPNGSETHGGHAILHRQRRRQGQPLLLHPTSD